MNNGSNLRVMPGFNKDPLAPKRHHVVASSDGKNFFVLGQPGQQHVADPIELLSMEVGGQHAIAFPNAEVRIMDEDHREVARFESYHVEPQDGPPSPERLAIRNRWLDNVMRFLLPPVLFSVRDNPNKQRALKRWFRRKKIEVQMRQDGGAVRIFRDGAVLSQWGC